MKKRFLGAIIASSMSIPVLADNFEAEAGLMFTNTDADFGPSSADVDSFTIVGSLYFDSVDTSKGPLAEAVFLDKESGVTAFFSDVDNPGDNQYGLSGRFVTDGGMIVEASYIDQFDSKTYGVGIGAYLSESSDVVISYATNSDADVDTLAGDYHIVTSLSGDASLGYTIIAQYIDADETGFGLGGDVTYYLDNYLGFGVSALTQEINDADVTSFGFHGSYFITPDFYVRGFVENVDLDGAERDSVGVGAFLRF